MAASSELNDKPHPSKTVSTTDEIHFKLVSMISDNTDNEQQVLKYLDNLVCMSRDGIQSNDIISRAKRALVNKPIITQYGKETMLMRASFLLKKQVVIKLLQLGAYPNFSNDTFESVATSWDVDYGMDVSEEKQKAILDVATILHNYGANLAQCGYYTDSIVIKAKQCNLQTLYQGLCALGYNDVPLYPD